MLGGAGVWVIYSLRWDPWSFHPSAVPLITGKSIWDAVLTTVSPESLWDLAERIGAGALMTPTFMLKVAASK